MHNCKSEEEIEKICTGEKPGVFFGNVPENLEMADITKNLDLLVAFYELKPEGYLALDYSI